MSAPHSAAEISRAAAEARLVPNVPVGLLVALPADAIPALEVDVDGSSMSWRGVTVARTGDVTVDCAAVAAAGWSDGDVPVDLASAVGWVRVVRSGTAKVCFGADAILRAGTVVADSHLTDDEIRTVLAALRAGGVSVGVSGGRDGRTLLVAPTDTGIRIGDLAATERSRTRILVDAATVAVEVAGELDAEVVDAVVTFERAASYEADLRLRVGGDDIVVPVVVGVDGMSVGAVRTDVAHTSTPPLIPAGFSWVGVDVFDGVAVAECDRSGICVKFPGITAQ